MKNLIILSALCLFLLVGCQQSVDDLVVNENYPISIEASIGDAGGSRYSGTTPNGAVFANISSLLLLLIPSSQYIQQLFLLKKMVILRQLFLMLK